MSHEIAEQIIRDLAQYLPESRRKKVHAALDPNTPPDLCSEKKAAEYLGISKAQLWRWRNGRLDTEFPFHTYTLPGGHVRYDRAELVQHITDTMYGENAEETHQ